MNQTYAIVEANGAINSIYSSPYLLIPCDEGLDDSAYYYDHKDSALKEKQKVNLETVVDGLVVSVVGVPEGMTVEVNGSSITSDGDELTVNFDVPGTYTLSFSGLVEYLNHSEEVTVGNP